MHLHYLYQVLQLPNNILCFAFGYPLHARADDAFVGANKVVFLPLLQKWMLDLV